MISPRLSSKADSGYAELFFEYLTASRSAQQLLENLSVQSPSYCEDFRGSLITMFNLFIHLDGKCYCKSKLSCPGSYQKGNGIENKNPQGKEPETLQATPSEPRLILDMYIFYLLGCVSLFTPATGQSVQTEPNAGLSQHSTPAWLVYNICIFSFFQNKLYLTMFYCFICHFKKSVNK